MTMSSRPFNNAATWRTIVAAAVAVIATLPARAQDAPSPFPASAAELLKQLQERDLKFDNLTLEVEKTWIEQVSPTARVMDRQFKDWKYGHGQPTIKIPKNLPKPYEQPHRVRNKLTLRGDEITFEAGEELEQLKHPEFGRNITVRNKQSNAGGVGRRYYEISGSKESYLHLSKLKPGFLYSERLGTELVLGYGFAKRMKAIDAYHIDGLRASCAGPIRIGDNDDCRCELKLDADLIVREAMIFIGSEGKGRTVVSTQGTVRPAGIPPVAATGHYRRISSPDPPPAKEHVYEDAKYRFIDAITALSDETYADIVRIEPKAGTMIEHPGGRVERPRGTVSSR